jgi:hypothetical protein
MTNESSTVHGGNCIQFSVLFHLPTNATATIIRMVFCMRTTLRLPPRLLKD